MDKTKTITSNCSEAVHNLRKIIHSNNKRYNIKSDSGNVWNLKGYKQCMHIVYVHLLRDKN